MKTKSEIKYDKFASRLLHPLINDDNRCECLEKPHNFMSLGGNVDTTVQCLAQATTKIIPLSDREKHIAPMFLCDKHLSWFKRDNKGYLSDYKFEKVAGLRHPNDSSESEEVRAKSNQQAQER